MSSRNWTFEENRSWSNDCNLDKQCPINIDTTDSSYCYTRYLIKNISVQKWNCLIISVDTKILDVYLDVK